MIKQDELLLTEIARMLYFNFEEYDEGTIAEVTWTTAPQARRDMWLEKARKILAKVKQHQQKRLDRPDRQKIFAILDKEYIGDDDKEASHEHHNQVLDQIEALFDKDRPFGTAQGEPELRDILRRYDNFMSGYYADGGVLDIDEASDQILALFPDIGEMEKHIKKQATDTIKGIEEMYEEDEANTIEEAKKQVGISMLEIIDNPYTVDIIRELRLYGQALKGE